EDHIVKREESEPAAQVLRSLVGAKERLGGLGASDQERNQEGEEEQRSGELARTRLGRQGAHERPRVSAARAPTSVPTAATPRLPRASTASSSGSAPPSPGRSRRIAKAGTATTSTATRNRSSEPAFARKSAVRSTGAS